MATQSRIGWRPYVTQVVNAVDADATAFIAAAGITNLTQAAAISTLVNDLKTYGLWTKMKALYPMVGGSATSHKFNLKDPRDLDAAYRLVFNGGWVHSSTGALPNGTTGYADTKLKPFGVFNNTTYAHISYYSRTSSGFNNSEYGMGVVEGTSNLCFVLRRLNNTQAFFSTFSNATYQWVFNTTSTNGSGLFVGTQQGTNIKLLKQNILQGSNTQLGSTTPPNLNVFIGALNLDGLSGNYTNKEAAFASVGDGLSDTEATNFYNSVQKFQTTLGRHVGTPYVSDPDAIAFLMAAGITDGTQAAAINTLVIRMKADGVWTKMKAIYPFVGGTATSHKFNLKDPRDLDAAYRLVFNGGWFHSSTGALPNGTTGYADTKLNENSVMTLGSEHMSYYSRTNILGLYVDMGVWNASSNYGTQILTRLTYLSSDSFLGYVTDANSAYITNTDSRGFFMTNRPSISQLKLQKNSSIITFSSNVINKVNDNFWIGARNINSNSYLYSPRETAFASIGDGLTDTEASNLYSAVQAYQTTLGRQVNIPVVSDGDAQSFLNAANITSFQQASAVNKLVVDLKAAGVWTKMKAIYPFVGGSATSHKFNLKDPRDLDAAYRLVFNGGWTHTSTGALPNGTTGYADTKMNANSTNFDYQSMSTTFYSRTNNSLGVNDIGVQTGSSKRFIELNIKEGNLSYMALSHQGISYLNFTNNDSRGFYHSNRIDSNTIKLYKNGTNVATGTQTSTNIYGEYSVYISALNARHNNNQVLYFSNREVSFTTLGSGLTDTESTALYTAVQTYQTTLGRAVDTPVYNNGLVLNLDAGNANSYPVTGTTWFDLASGNNGTLVNGPTYDATSGGSILFDGTNDYANFGNVQSLNSLTSGVTIGAWIKSSSTTTYSAILQKWYQSGMQGGFQLFISSGGILTLAIGDFITGYSGGSSTVSVITGSWVYVTATYDMNAIKIYINGVLNSTTSLVRSVVNSNNATLFLGQDDYGGRFFRGNISSATVHNRALTSTEILSNFNSTRGRFGL